MVTAIIVTIARGKLNGLLNTHKKGKEIILSMACVQNSAETLRYSHTHYNQHNLPRE